MLKEIALKYNKPYYVIEEVFLSQFKLVKDSMRDEELPTIKLISFGKFIPAKEKVKRYREYKEKELNGEYDGKYPRKSDKGDKGNALPRIE